tara:strand:- start:2799 stop:2966 length:168 start_codon:yes stop_codon:yes gene_type:complete
MKTYKVTFTGRKLGAIGIFYKISTTTQAPENATDDEIGLTLYDHYEHIQELKIIK